MQAQSQQEQVTQQPQRLLGPREALAWLTASGLYTIFALGRIVYTLQHNRLPEFFYFVTPIAFFLALHAWRRVQRGERVGDPLVALDALPNRFLRACFFLTTSMFFIGSIAFMIMVTQSARFSAWMQLPVLCMFGANIIVGTLLAQHWRRKRRHNS